uniref:Gypsy retrotransposon integrase-like protein 1 n=1 Tax=Nothobranchius furzeri TaxID=105023 RepID=A0A1A8UYG6_NOTFU
MLGCTTLPAYTEAELQQLQQSDPIIKTVVNLLEAGEEPVVDSHSDSLELRLMLKEWTRLTTRNGLLYRVRQADGDLCYQFVVPSSLRTTVLTCLHDDMGHMGLERTIDLVRSRFYWPKMMQSVEHKIKTCGRCVRRKTPPEKSAPLINIQTSRPMELVCMDYLSLEPDSHNTKDILVITDHFTKYAVAIPTKDQKAITVAKNLWEQFFVHYGFPERLLSDQGRDFESQLIKELCILVGSTKVRTSPYHPRGNPVERFNRTLLSMLGTLKNKDKSHWRDYVKPLTHAYNCTKNEVTGYSPYELMFGRQPRLPIDISFNLPAKGGSPKSHSQYVKNLKAHLEESYQVATQNSKRVADRNKRRFDKAVRESVLETGDKVLVRNLRLRNKHKLTDKWESTVYKVLTKVSDLPVYKVEPISGDGPIRTLHRDHLLACGDLCEEEETKQPEPRPCRPKTRPKPPHPREEYSDSDDDLPYTHLPLSHDGRFTHLCSIPKLLPVGHPSSETQLSRPESQVSNLPDPMQTAPGISERGPHSPTVNQNLSEGNQRNMGNENPLDVMNQTGTDNLLDVINQTGNGNLPDTMNNKMQENTESDSALTCENNVNKSESKTLTDKDTVRRSERSRRPPDRFYYSQLGKPLISFAQSFLGSFNEALDAFSNNDNYLTHQQEHEGTQAKSRGESVTHEKYWATKPVYVV